MREGVGEGEDPQEGEGEMMGEGVELGEGQLVPDWEG